MADGAERAEAGEPLNWVRVCAAILFHHAKLVDTYAVLLHQTESRRKSVSPEYCSFAVSLHSEHAVAETLLSSQDMEANRPSSRLGLADSHKADRDAHQVSKLRRWKYSSEFRYLDCSVYRRG